MKDIQCSKHNKTGEEKVVRDEPRKNGMQIMQRLIQFVSKFTHYSKSNEKTLMSFNKDNNSITCAFLKLHNDWSRENRAMVGQLVRKQLQ